MSFERTLYFDGDAGTIIERIKATFLPLDFQIVDISDNSIELTMSYFKTGFHDNSLVFISRIFVSVENNKVFIKADLRNDKINTLLALLAIIGVPISLYFIHREHSSIIIPIMIIFAIAWIPLIPFMIWGGKSKLNAALETFCNNLACSKNSNIQF